jgi:hypothetical protein
MPRARSFLSSIAAAQKATPLAVTLRVLRLSPSRYHAWRGLDDGCPLDVRSSCPRTTLPQLTAAEISIIGEMVTDESFRHISFRDLVLHAQRIALVFASMSTWARLVRDSGWL